MWLTRLMLPIALAIATLIACLAPRSSRPPDTIPARELLVLAQEAGGANYTFNRATAATLERVEVARPPAGAGLEQLEAELHEAGFSLRPLGTPEKRVFLVEPAGG